MTDARHSAEETVAFMRAGDHFSRWLGIDLVALKPDHCTLRMTVRQEMCNGFNICHGGVTYSLADSALAFAANANGRLAMSAETNIVHSAKVVEGDVLTAVAAPKSISHKLATYDVNITNQHNVVVGIFRGTVYRTSRYVLDARSRS